MEFLQGFPRAAFELGIAGQAHGVGDVVARGGWGDGVERGLHFGAVEKVAQQEHGLGSGLLPFLGDVGGGGGDGLRVGAGVEIGAVFEPCAEMGLRGREGDGVEHVVQHFAVCAAEQFACCHVVPGGAAA